MQPQRAARRHARVLERARLVFLHADALHHRARAAIAWHCEGNDLVQSELLVAKPERRARAFGGETFAPMGLRQPPADFHARRTGKLRDRRLQADEADEFAGVPYLRRPKTP